MVRIATLRISAMLGMLLCFLAIAPAADAASTAVTTTPEQRTAASGIAMRKVGRWYLRGAAGPNRFDCSGLVNFAYRGAGHPLAARSSFELFRVGAHIRRTALQPGDLVWTWDRSLGHVGMYVGNGRYVHAPGAGRKVEVAPLPAGAGFVGAVRP
jgi:cell wall-associated NlpC family hydrolase